MSKRDTMIRALCKSLGVDYRVTTIDLERVIYRDFGNGFNVEISGMHTSSMKKKGNNISLVWRYNDRMHHRKNCQRYSKRADWREC